MDKLEQIFLLESTNQGWDFLSGKVQIFMRVKFKEQYMIQPEPPLSKERRK